MEILESIGGVLLGIAFFVGSIIALILFFTVGATVGVTILPFVSWLTGILFAVNIIALLIAISRKTRGVVGIIIFLSSYVYGLQTWIIGLLVTLTLWGWIAVIIGLFIGGIGVVPIGMAAAIFNGRWSIFFVLLINVILTYGTRIIGGTLAESAGRANE
jgi:membrane protein